MNQPVLGLFPHVDSLVEAGVRLKDSGYTVTVFSPIPLGDALDPIKVRPNYIRYFALFGAFVGFLFGLLLTLGTAAMYVLPRGGLPIWPITPTLLLTYESIILFGVIWTLIGFCIVARKPYFGKQIYDPKVSLDSFGLLVEDIREDKLEEVEQILSEHGADEVNRVEKS